VLPQLRELEQRFPDRLVVVGVHSGKYIAERVTARIREAALRYEVHHPIVNDRQFRVWRSYAVRAWPTLAVVDPTGYVLGLHAGEFTSAMLAPLVEQMLAREGGAAPPAPHAPTVLDRPGIAPGTLRYPGKVAVDGARIAVADSGHHRVLVGVLEDGGRRMRVDRVIGGGGDDSGVAADALFRAPQGLAFAGETLFVADPGAHVVRAIDLSSGGVRTVAGIAGRQLRTQADLDAGALSSPWDVVVVGDTLYVAMAGTHQLWAVGTDGSGLRVHAGGRGEDLVDGPLATALLAQPMGIATDGERLYFVDAESSAVRAADLAPAGAVHTIVGTGLFDFGDEDGTGDDVRMQHQQGVALHPAGGRLLVADSYNDSLKWVEPVTRRVETWVRDLHEPGGVAFGAGRVYVADTNAHRIAVVDEATGAVAALEIAEGAEGAELTG
jgi:DNA-binding beta-propeller fold protein YncE